MTSEIQKTHFADDDTLAYISRLERDRAELIEALRNVEKLCGPAETVSEWGAIDKARSLLSRLGADK